jgi:Xaa-Pro dipeptidase
MDRPSRLISEAGTDAVVIMNGGTPFLDPAFWYVTEQRSGSFEGTIAVISKDGRLDVIVNRLEELSAKGGKGNIRVYSGREERDTLLRTLLKDCRTIGMNAGSVTYAGAEYIRKISGAEITDVSGAVLSSVSIKDASEIKAIREACRIASEAADSIPEFLREGMTEKEAAAEIDGRMRSLGAEGNAFDTIAAFGEFSAEPHHRPCGRRLRKGDAALFDLGCRYEMYCSDLTRTVFFGDPDDRLARAYGIVSEAKAAGMGKIRDGVAAKDIDTAARDVIDMSEFKGSFIHSFGHGIGMNVHEGISVSHLSGDILKENMVVSAEPGIYIPGVGGVRIEDTVLVKKDGCETLTRSDQSMTVIR